MLILKKCSAEKFQYTLDNGKMTWEQRKFYEENGIQHMKDKFKNWNLFIYCLNSRLPNSAKIGRRKISWWMPVNNDYIFTKFLNFFVMNMCIFMQFDQMKRKICEIVRGENSKL